jgi:uncharacterized phage-associated protein
MSYLNYKKATQVLNFFAMKCGGEIDTLMAMKYVWLSDRLHLRIYGRSITNDTYYAMKLGPVPSGTYNIVKNDPFIEKGDIEYSSQYLAPKDNKKQRFISTNMVDETVFSKSDLKVLNSVFEKFSNMTKWQLSDYSHLFDEWTRYKEQLEKNPKGRFEVIPDDFFNETNLGDDVFNQSKETLDCLKELFEENKAFKK